MRRFALAFALLPLLAVPARAQEKGKEKTEEEVVRDRLLVLDFAASEGVKAAVVDVANDTFISTLSEIDRFELTTSADLRMMLDTEKQRQLISCSDDSCMAEIAGAFGARFLSRGRLSLLDENVTLTLQLFDSKSAALEKQLTRPLPAGSNAIGDTVRGMTFELLSLEDETEPDAWYENTWLWVGIGTVVVGGVIAAVVLSGSGDSGEPNLGRFTFDG